MRYDVHKHDPNDQDTPWKRLATLEGGRAFNVELDGYLPKGGLRWQLVTPVQLVGSNARGRPIVMVVMHPAT